MPAINSPLFELTSKTFTMTVSQAQAVKRAGGILDVEQLEGMDQPIVAAVPTNCTAENLAELLAFIEHGTCTLSILKGDLTNEARFLGIDHMFDDHGAGFAGHTWEFILGLSGMPSVLWQFLTDRKSRRTMLSWKDASKATLQPFTKRALEDVPIEVINSKSALLSPDQPTKELDWDNLHAALHKLPKGMPWAGPTNKGPGILLCGGALESWLRGKQANDIDLFIVIPGPIEPTEETHQQMVNDVVLKTMHAIRAHHGSSCDIYVSKNKWHVVDILVYSQGQPLVKYQIVTRVFASMAQVLEGFDIDSCRLGYDGTSVWAHQTALRAWKNGWNLFNACALSNSALHRYSKKWLAGMGILFPGHSQEKLENTIDFLATHDVRGCLPNDITKLPLTIDGLLVFMKATDDDPSLLRSCVSDYDAEILPAILDSASTSTPALACARTRTGSSLGPSTP
ncbi:hypothetical protein HXX76_014125 [Chlamydomonas incerta]|uniref:Uncharacterized protein n=1 Tax=Chlamydomonas incerta TaxID=51695 RepID=A0A835SHH8_CHLIN|nr:hypothetical protein HXX76_014125 [Chlamydomonas incerta]|eukprot:KAG2424967.1 hypothetical protein HXX76_014125 [Chlamydomonas incerta]